VFFSKAAIWPKQAERPSDAFYILKYVRYSFILSVRNTSKHKNYIIQTTQDTLVNNLVINKGDLDKSMKYILTILRVQVIIKYKFQYFVRYINQLELK